MISRLQNAFAVSNDKQDGDSTERANSGGNGENGALWPDYVPLDDEPDVEAFPVDEVFPSALGTLLREVSWSMNCPVDYAAVPSLTMAGGAIGNRRRVRIKGGYLESAVLYTGVVGRAGTTKSSAQKLLEKPFQDVQLAAYDVWKKKMQEWKSQDAKDRGEKPVQTRCIVDDVTSESLMLLLHENPQGLLQIKDELAGLLAGMNQYKGGRGHDRQVYLAIWSSKPITVDRKSDKSLDGGSLIIPRPFVAISGTIQPSKLVAFGSRNEDDDDGFMDRFLFAYPRELPAVGETWREVSQGSLDAWAKCIRKLLGMGLQTDESGRPKPRVLSFDADAQSTWQSFTHELARERNGRDFPHHLHGPWSKLQGYGARIALILQLLRWACDECGDDCVDGESMRRAVLIVRYFMSHTRKVTAVVGADKHTNDARRIATWIQRQNLFVFSKRDCYQALKGGHFKCVTALDAGLGILEDRFIILPVDDEKQRRGPGRKPSPRYLVHPHFLQNPQKGD